MTSFVLETYVPDGDRVRFGVDVDGLRRTAGSVDPVGRIRYVASYLVPSDEMAFHLVDAATLGDVERAASEAGIEAERIVEAVDVDAGRWSRSTDPSSGGPG